MEVEVKVPASELEFYLAGHHLEIVQRMWYSSFKKNYWIISVKTIDWNIKHYLGVQYGLNEDEDTLSILQNGAKFYPNAFAQFIS